MASHTSEAGKATKSHASPLYGASAFPSYASRKMNTNSPKIKRTACTHRCLKKGSCTLQYNCLATFNYKHAVFPQSNNPAWQNFAAGEKLHTKDTKTRYKVET
ncbi:hypothetical protein T11_10506 [Trichinella zimbabwensis]|uniref:Uncharacterized protein n=1 Tax=Trichinella zimbabwensis TaxID=268475 RepID=A0A0V1HMT9_9BILA|nr:hypothetical protein T11_10506 [Trichinella zimbabwensis]